MSHGGHDAHHEPKDAFEKRAAITISILAVFLSLTAGHGNNAKTEAIIKTSEASNRWSHYQSKSIKQYVHQDILDGMGALNGASLDKEAYGKLSGKLGEEIRRYDSEKKEIKNEAEIIQKSASRHMKVNHICEIGSILFEIAIILTSVSILIKRPLLWFCGAGLGCAGLYFLGYSFLV
jgi:hypothetical protein